jgi:hypothetical protein
MHPAASNTSPAARTRIRPKDVPNQRRSTFTRSSDAVKLAFFDRFDEILFRSDQWS